MCTVLQYSGKHGRCQSSQKKSNWPRRNKIKLKPNCNLNNYGKKINRKRKQTGCLLIFHAIRPWKESCCEEQGVLGPCVEGWGHNPKSSRILFHKFMNQLPLIHLTLAQTHTQFGYDASNIKITKIQVQTLWLLQSVWMGKLIHTVGYVGHKQNPTTYWHFKYRWMVILDIAHTQ